MPLAARKRPPAAGPRYTAAAGPRDAQARAYAAGLDLVEISPNADPPVCKILDYGKFKYEQQKKKNEAKKKQKVIEIKEIKVRPNIDENDYQVKLRAMKTFIEEGDKVKVTLRFRGREMAHQDIGIKVLERIRTDLECYADKKSVASAADDVLPGLYFLRAASLHADQLAQAARRQHGVAVQRDDVGRAGLGP